LAQDAPALLDEVSPFTYSCPVLAIANMDVLGSAAIYATGAYSYNLGRYQFDTVAEQKSAQFASSLRQAQFNLFREDLRELFALTTTNLSAYMVKGTLFLGYTIAFVREMKPPADQDTTPQGFPLRPYWLLLLFCNCVVTSLAFSLLAVWLAMHGTISAHSTCVKVMTTMVRPPIPTAAAAEEMKFSQAKFHQSGALGMFKPPDVFGMVEERNLPASALPSHAPADELTAEQDAPTAEQAFLRGMESVSALRDSEGIESGKSSKDDPHVQLFKEIQSTYACFDAYSRISLSVAVNYLLLVVTYYFLGVLMEQPHSQTPYMQRAFCWSAVGMLVVTARAILKLDLFVDKTQESLIKELYLAGPLIGCAAAQLWANKNLTSSKYDVPKWLIVLLSFVCMAIHALWILLIMWHARPDESSGGLPTSFRSVHYLDVFGWMGDGKARTKEPASVGTHEDAAVNAGTPGGTHDEEVTRNVDEDKLAMNAVKQARQLMRKSEHMLKPETLEHFSAEEAETLRHNVELLEAMTDDLNEVHGRRGSSMSSLATTGEALWLKSEWETDAGQIIPYWIEAKTAEVSWDPPPDDSESLDLGKMNSTVLSCQDRLGLLGDSGGRRSSRPSGMSAALRQDAPLATEMLQRRSVRFDQEPQDRNADASSSRGSVASASSRRSRGSVGSFQPMGQSTDSSSDEESIAYMPWKHFKRVGLCAVSLWVFSVGYVLTEDVFVLVTRPNYDDDDDGDNITVAWPHAHFRPSALACADGALAIGDSFEFYIVAAGQNSLQRLVQPAGAVGLNLEPLEFVGGSDTLGRWRGISLVCNGAQGCSSLLLLSPDGKLVTQHYIARGVSHRPSRRWHLSQLTNSELHAIAVVQGAAASSVCEPLSSELLQDQDSDWALYAITERHEVLSLCPFEGRLEPVHVVAGNMGAKFSQGDKFSGLSIGTDGSFWFLVQDKLKQTAQVRSWSADGKSHRKWTLPTARLWTPGMCLLKNGSGVILAASQNTSGLAARPELWHFKFARNGSVLT